MSDLVSLKRPTPAATAGSASSDNEEYSPFKAAWHLDRIEALRRGEHVAPVHVHFILSDLCNQDCDWCAYRMSGYTSNQLFADPEGNRNPKRMLPGAKAEELIRSFAKVGVKAVEFTGGGEPSVHPDFDRLINLTVDLGMSAAVVSNGVLVRRKVSPETAKRVAWWRISLDAATEETYIKTRRVPTGHFAAAQETVRWLAELKQPGQIIGTGFVVSRDNWHEAYRGVEMAKLLGADNVRMSALFSTEGARYYDAFYQDARKEVLSAVKDFHAPPNFRVFQRFSEKLNDLQLSNPDYSECGYERLVTYVAGDQNVYRCCVYSYNDRGLLGSVKDQTFEQMWFSDEVRTKLETFDARGCERCQFNDRNHFINYLVRSDPPPSRLVCVIRV